MKRYTDLTHEELIALNEDDLKRYIDIEIAFAGITPAPEPVPIGEFDPGIKPEIIAFEVCGLIVKTIEEAQKVAALNIYSSDYDYYGAGSKFRYLSDRWGSNDIKKVSFYNKEEVLRMKGMLKDRKELVEHYEAQKAEWEKYLEKIQGCRSEVMDAYRAAVGYQQTLNYGRAQFARFLTLAEGDESIACRFFYDAFKDNAELIKAVLPGGFSLEKKEEPTEEKATEA